MLNRVSLALLLTLTASASTGAWAQPAVPAVGPAPARPGASQPAPSASDLPPTTAPTTAAPTTAPVASAPVARPAPPVAARADDPPTTDFTPAPTVAPPVTTATAPRPAAAPAVGGPAATDAPPTSAPTTAPAANAPATADAPPSTAATAPAAPTADTLQTVPRNASLTPEGNAAFIAIYKARPDVVTLPSGAMYRVLVAGKGTTTPISRLDTITISYRGWLIDGTQIDSSAVGTPRSFQIAGLIEGWRDVVLKMKVGDAWELVIPAALAYGAEGRAGRIPPNQTLIFVVSMSKIEYAG